MACDRETHYVHVGIEFDRRANAPAQSRAAGRDSGDSTTIRFDYSSVFPMEGRARRQGGNREAPKRQSWKGPGETRRAVAGEAETKERARSQNECGDEVTGIRLSR